MEYVDNIFALPNATFVLGGVFSILPLHTTPSSALIRLDITDADSPNRLLVIHCYYPYYLLTTILSSSIQMMEKHLFHFHHLRFLMLNN